MANWLPQALRSGFNWNVAVMYLRWSEPYRPHCQWQDCDNGASIEIHWLANFWQFRPHRPVEEQTLKQVLMRCHYNVSSMFLVDTCTEYFNFFSKEIFELHLEAWETIIGGLKSSRTKFAMHNYFAYKKCLYKKCLYNKCEYNK